MKKLQNLFYGYILFACALSLADLLTKYMIIQKFEQGEMLSLLNGWVAIGRIENLRLPLGFNGGLGFFGYLVIAIQLVFVFYFMRIQLRKVDNFFKFSSALIVFGWMGNYLDRLFFANGNWAYVHLDYFNLTLAGNAVINISSLMILIGWIVLVVISLIRFNEFKSIFRENRNLSAGN